VVVLLPGISEDAANPAGLLRRRRRARTAVAAAHLAGVLVPFVLAGFTEGPSASFSGTAGLALAWLNVAVIAAACAAQAAAVAAWRRRRAALRAAGVRGRRPGRLILAGCAGLLVLATWTWEAGLALEAAAAIRAGGLDEPDSALGIWMDVWALLGAGFTVAATPALLVLAYPARWLVRQTRRTPPLHWDWLPPGPGPASAA
jgi:hypothetical protein